MNVHCTAMRTSECFPIVANSCFPHSLGLSWPPTLPMMAPLSTLLSLLLLHSSLACSTAGERSRRSAASQEHPTSALHRDILDGYNKDVIPILTAPSTDSADNAVIFNLGIQMVRMDMDEEKKVLTATTWPKMSWMDFRLKWNPDHYSGVQNVKIPATKVWRPDLEVTCSYFEMTAFV